jgi:hypothetical protein
MTTLAIGPAAPEVVELPAALLEALARPASAASVIVTNDGQTFVLHQVR